MEDRFDLKVAAFTELGRRERNEDGYAEMRSDDGRVRAFAVADGLGGHDRGEVASAAAIAAARARVAGGSADGDLPGLVAEVFAAANAAVGAARADVPHSEMATTFALAVTDGATVAWGHSGDTRIYRLRGGALERLTRDHTVEGSLAAIGARRAPGSAHSNALLAVLDGRELVYEPAAPEALLAGDAYLLCSDGVWSVLAEREMVAAARAAADLEGWIDSLRAGLLRAGDPAQDNATALAFAFGAGGFAPPRKERTILRRILGR